MAGQRWGARKQLTWDDDLTPEQKTAASAHDGHARVLAGPGTGKTFTLKARVQYLVEELSVEPSRILVVTFTRKAVAELRDRILPCTPEGAEPPRISTLHGFALRQLLRNASLVEALPAPFRVADDWEEATIVIPDLKRLLKKGRKEVRAALGAMSADWDTLTDAELKRMPRCCRMSDLEWRPHGRPSRRRYPGSMRLRMPMKTQYSRPTICEKLSPQPLRCWTFLRMPSTI